MKALSTAAAHGLANKVPFGWYAVGPSSGLRPGALRRLVIADNELVVFRTETGEAAVADAYCPHLGAHFAHGGTVEGETIRCPFHGFCFDTDGTCVKTGYDTKPPAKARLRMWPTREVNGFVFAWYHPEAAPPSFELPEFETDGWSDLLEHCWEIDGHPQETTENSVDLGHFSIVHGYTAVEEIEPCSIDGAVLSARYQFRRPLEFAGGTREGATAVLTIGVHGLGFSTVHTQLDDQGIQLRLYVLATPTTPGRIALRVGLRVRLTGSPRQIHPLLAVLPRPIVQWFISRASFHGYRKDISQDFEIWRHKAYIPRPALARGDGPIGRYRRYVRQFYIEPTPELIAEAN